VPDTIANYREWHAALHFDPSGADLYHTDFDVDLVEMAFSLALGTILFLVLPKR